MGNNSIDLPSNWILQNTKNDYDLVDLDPVNREYQAVSGHFIQRLQNNSIRISKVKHFRYFCI